MTGTIDHDYYNYNQRDIDCSEVNEERLATIAQCLDETARQLLDVVSTREEDPNKLNRLQTLSRITASLIRSYGRLEEMNTGLNERRRKQKLNSRFVANRRNEEAPQTEFPANGPSRLPEPYEKKSAFDSAVHSNEPTLKDLLKYGAARLAYEAEAIAPPASPARAR